LDVNMFAFPFPPFIWWPGTAFSRGCGTVTSRKWTSTDAESPYKARRKPSALRFMASG
jgi:hypothetical protein